MPSEYFINLIYIYIFIIIISFKINCLFLLIKLNGIITNILNNIIFYIKSSVK